MKRGARLRSVSKKRRDGREVWDQVYHAVDLRSSGWCEVRLNEFRCGHRGTERHHCVKPRASNHDPDKVIKICAEHHRLVEAPYATGRLVIIPLGFGRFACRIVTAGSKMQARARGLIP